MHTQMIAIDVSNQPELTRIIAEMSQSHTPRKLTQGKKTVAILMPVESTVKQPKSRKQYQKFLAAAGSLHGLLDADTLKQDIYESRALAPRPLRQL